MKHGKLQKAAFKKPGGKTLEDWIDNCPNADYAARTYQRGAAWRARLMADIGGKPNVTKLLDGFDDEALAALMTNLGRHCIETLIESFHSADDDRSPRSCASTAKGTGLDM